MALQIRETYYRSFQSCNFVVINRVCVEVITVRSVRSSFRGLWVSVSPQQQQNNGSANEYPFIPPHTQS